MENNSTRIYFLDAMRSILMMLGVVIHSAQVFNPEKSWRIYSENSTDFSVFVLDILLLFRMPTFFVISGFFCILTLRKYRAKKFIQIRFKRIIIPILTTAFTLNLLQYLLLYYTGWSNELSLKEYFLHGGWVSHLWFLNTLLLYFCLTTLLFTVTKGMFRKVMMKISSQILSLPLLILIFFMPLLLLITLGLNKTGFPLYSNFMGAIYMSSFLKYLPYFVMGILLGFNKPLLIQFSNQNIKLLIGLVLGSALILNYSQLFNGWFSKIINIYFESLTGWLSIVLVFNLFHRYFNKPSKLWLFMSGSSYTVYLFHHLFVILLGLLIIQYNVPGIMGMLLLILGTLTTTISIHYYFISKIKTARFLFNGQ